MLRLHATVGMIMVVAGCGSSDDGGSGGAAGSGGSGGSSGAGATGGSAGSSGSAGSAGSSGRGGSAGSGGSSGRGGSAGSGGGGTGGTSGTSGRVCGGLAGLTCDADEWCDYDDNCGDGDMQGVCTPKPGACTKDCPGVCGCNGMRYCNACEAQQAGIDVSPTVSCPP